MKILNITSSGFAEGGTENGLILTKPLYEKRGHIVKTFASDTRPDLEHFNDYSYKAPPDGPLGKLLYTANPYAYTSLKKALRDFQPDVVHVHAIGYASPIILFPLKDYPVVYTIHGPEAFIPDLLIWCFPRSYFRHGLYTMEDLTPAGKLRYNYQRYIEGLLYQKGLKNITMAVTFSSYMHDLVERTGIHNVLVPNGTRLFPYHPLTKTKNMRTILSVGRLMQYKGVSYLLDAMPRILSSFPDARLVIAGEGEERTNLEEQARKLGIHRAVKFLGRLSRSELLRTYASASVVVVPSIWPEAFGKVGIEAMSVGRPVVATKVGGISDWLTHGKNGLSVPPKNANAIALSVIKLFSDPARLVRMGTCARTTAEKFNLDTHVNRMELIFRDAIRTYSRPSPSKE